MSAPTTRGYKSLIGMTIADMVADFLDSDRKEDEDLPRGAIEAAIASGEVTLEYIIERFTIELREAFHE